MYTTINANEEQTKKLFEKHVKPFWGISKIFSKSFSYDSDDGIGFVTLYTITGKKIEFQMRRDEPCFVEFTGFGDIRYDVFYPEKSNKELYEILKKYGLKAQTKFWKGGQI
jgi:hypothetical protein